MGKKIKLRVLSIVLLLVIALTSCSRSTTLKSTDSKETTQKETSSKPAKKTQPSSKEAKAEQEAFDAYMDEIFVKELPLNIINLHFLVEKPQDFGIKSYDVTMGQPTREEFDKAEVDMNEYLDKVNSFNYDYLTDKQQLTYKIIKTSIEDSLKSCDFYLYSEYLSPLKGLQSQIPTLLSDYAFNNEKDVQDYINILALYPEYFKNIMIFEKEKSDAGLFMPDYEVDEVIDQCNQFLSDKDNHYLIQSFNDRVDALDFLTDDQKTSYKAQNVEATKTYVYPTYDYLISEITTLKGTCKNDGGLCNVDKGKDYYELLVRDNTGSNKSVEDIEAMIKDQYYKDLDEMSKICEKNSNVYSDIRKYDVDTSDPKKIMDYLQDKIKDDFPEGPDTNLKIMDVPKAIEKYQAPAYYLIPALDNYESNVIYINKSKENVGQNLYSTLAHEGFPGHLYQTTYYMNTKPANIRSLFSFTSYDEGWATYAENYSYTFSGQSEDIARLNQLNTNTSFAIYCLCDIGINYDGWTKEDTVKFCATSYINEVDATKIYQTLIEEPALYLRYYESYLEFLELRDKAEKELGNKFNIKDFHQFILETGPAQFEIIDEWMDKWIDEQKKS